MKQSRSQSRGKHLRALWFAGQIVTVKYYFLFHVERRPFKAKAHNIRELYV